MPELGLPIVTAGIPLKDGCPVLRRLRAFIAPAGVASILQHTFVDSAGRALDIRRPLAVSESSAASASLEEDAVLLRLREVIGLQQQTYAVEGQVLDAAAGTVQATLPAEVYNQSGIYRLSWGFMRDGLLVLVNDALLSVEKSLFGVDAAGCIGDGPPTLGEIRMHLYDSDAAENPLLDDVEFNDEQLLTALARPLEYFNSALPPLGIYFDTTNFPWKTPWLDGVAAYLLEMAAARFRRNRLDVNAGGMNINDMSKEPEYLRAASYFRQRWESFVLQKKTELNMAACVGMAGSSYAYAWRR